MLLNQFRFKHSLAELAVQAFHKGILGRFARLDKVQLDGLPLAPKEHRMAGELSAVAADDGIEQAASLLEVDLRKCDTLASVMENPVSWPTTSFE